MSNQKNTKTKKTSSKKVSRSYSRETLVKLWTRSGGRCEFNGHNEYLLIDELSLKESNQSNIAHIVGLEGPRSKDPLPMDKRNEVENLMLVCKKHHGIIDDKKFIPAYPKEKLLEMKKVHEARILHQNSVQPGAKTYVISIKSKIAGEIVQVENEQIEEAIYPRYSMQKRPLEIDLTKLPDREDKALWQIGMGIISEWLDKNYHRDIASGDINHVSVFGLAPIPLLMYLGNQLSNKVTTNLYQRHRNPEGWVWKTEGDAVKYKIRVIKTGADRSKVALALSLSGPTALDSLPKEVLNDYTVYEITLDGLTPNPGFLRKKEDLAGFQAAYQSLLGQIRGKHGALDSILLFPAIPAPVAIMCGRELLKKVHPTLKIYDLDKKKGGFNYVLSVN